MPRGKGWRKRVGVVPDLAVLGLAVAIALGALPGAPGVWTPEGWSPEAWGNEPRSPALELTELDPEARSRYEAGLAYAHRGLYERAIAEFDAAIRLAPTFAAAFQDRGSSHLALQNRVAAMAYYNRAIRLAPNDRNAYYNRGNLHLQQEQYFRAIADYNRAITLNESDAAAWQNRALGYAVTGNLEQAVTGFQQAARLFQLQGNPEGYRQVLQILEYFQPESALQELDAQDAQGDPPADNPQTDAPQTGSDANAVPQSPPNP